MLFIQARTILLWCASLFALCASALESTNPVTIPITLNRGRVIFTGRINDSKPLRFLLDTGCTIPTLHPNLVDELGLQPSGRLTINGIAGDERAPTYRGVVIDLGLASYSPSRVASIPSERSERRRRDGVVGSGFLRRFVASIDPQTKTMTLHASSNFVYTGQGEVLPFRFKSEIPILKASLVLPDQTVIEGEFELDTGCDSGLCLGESFVQKHKLLDHVKTKSDEKFGVGGSIRTESGTIPALRLAGLTVREPQTDFFVGGSPVDEPLAGHIGMGVLRKYRVIFDYPRRQLILEE
jgi:hypothetical protein